MPDLSLAAGTMLPLSGGRLRGDVVLNVEMSGSELVMMM